MTLDREMREKRPHVGGTEIAWMPLAVKANVALRPVDVDLLRPQRVVLDADPGTQLIEQLRRW